MSDKKIKVLLIEDSGLMRLLISEILHADSELDLIATAVNGKEGVEKIHELKPDVVVSDVMMPEYDGLYVLKQLQNGPIIPVILLSSLERTDSQVFEALHNGAFDFVDKPKNAQQSTEGYALVPLIKQAAKSKASVEKIKKPGNANPHTFGTNLFYDLVVIGASTGGPGAVEYILNNLPENFALPVVIVQHMPERFIETFTQRLNAKGALTVKIALKGEELQPGTVYLAPGHSNLKIDRSILNKEPVFTFTKKEFKEYNFPSIDCLFSSASEIYGAKVFGVLLTGMGKDGADGLLKIKTKGGYTIAQDESTSVVFGMPKAAFDMGATKHLMKLSDIPGFIVSSITA